ncbi:MAG: hypothetical protein AB7N71_05505, partial [Phycisphaerae bacterium]
MTRNIVLFVSLVALAAVGYYGFLGYLGDSSEASIPEENEVALPANSDQVESIKIGPIPMEPGKEAHFTRFDPRTNEELMLFEFKGWSPVRDSKQEIAVTSPRIMIRQGRGLVVAVVADHGQVTMERVDQRQGSPQRGALEGDVRILIDRADSLSEFDANAPTPERITIQLEDLQFDLQAGTMATKGKLLVLSEEFEIAGAGLFLEWSESDN